MSMGNDASFLARRTTGPRPSAGTSFSVPVRRLYNRDVRLALHITKGNKACLISVVEDDHLLGAPVTFFSNSSTFL